MVRFLRYLTVLYGSVAYKINFYLSASVIVPEHSHFISFVWNVCCAIRGARRYNVIRSYFCFSELLRCAVWVMALCINVIGKPLYQAVLLENT